MRKLYLTFFSLWVAAAGMAQPDNTVITTPPAGTVYNLYRSSTGYESFYYNAIDHQSDGDWGRLVITDAGEVYLENPINSFYTQSWLKGQKAAGDTIAFQLPQAIYSETYGGQTSYGYAFRMKPTEDGTNYKVDSVSQVLKYVFRNDSLVKVDEDMLGVGMENGAWISYGELTSVNRVIADNTAKPEYDDDVQAGLMLYMSGEAVRQAPVKYAMYDNQVWLGGLTSNLPDKWIRGTMTDNVATFPAESLLGIDTITRSYVYACNANVQKVSDQYSGDYWEPSFLTEPMEFEFDPSTGTLFNRGNLVVNRGNMQMNSSTAFDIIQHPQISPWEDVPATPLPPVFTNYMPYEQGLDGGIEFKVSFYGSTGDGEDPIYLNPQKLYYNVYFDGELQTFMPDEYPELKAAMTDVPFMYNSYNFEVYDENTRRVYFHHDVKFFGVEALYVDGDTRLGSGITTYTTDPTGIHPVSDRARQIDHVSYTDLMGRRVERPVRGIYIRTFHFKDGSVKTDKVNIK